MIAFIESKTPNMNRVTTMLDECRKVNQWANRGPLYHGLADAYAAHFGLGADRAVVPCANGGVALEAMARLLELEAGRRFRWVGSAFSFQNLGRGHFAGMTFVDCDDRGVMDIEAVRALDPDSFDGLVVVNPFGLMRDFSAHIAFAKETGKALLFDNAAGVDRILPDWPWQSFSLHHTKPYGAGEGGLALVPADMAEPFYRLLDYGPAPADPAIWFNNGKISDIACAFQLDRLERVADWAPLYMEQAARIARLAEGTGLRPVRPFDGDAAPATSWVYLADGAVTLENLRESRRITYAKYYKPLAPLPRTLALYARLVNVPTHPDMARLGDGELTEELARVAAGAMQAKAAE